ncbi:FAD-binding oxidoreductase [Herbiconiux flava]|uniref:FAD/FMN-containing dehydrogenase n=1 Tax=Herbiconiux flava TaxID=881268 RepID=A0A852SSK5_9MICO|nr:FAD-binding oxidoreductase [Herbiconiux flava]NYD71859.1 FAD/FMN-containing dehydrogenase [Herbiconiux flava]GLK18178.1 FAD-linked oxidase [Herbiconiux flava]
MIAELRPETICAGDERFEGAVVEGVFNAMVAGGRPVAVVRPRNEAEVVQAVRDAAAVGQRVAVRSGGHSWVAASVREGGVLIDLGELDGIAVDAEAMVATIGPGVRGKALSAALEAKGLAFPVGHCGDPGVGGFLLGGGLGVNWGAWLPSCFSIRSLRVVTADGELRTASVDENQDLFWLARGVGPGFPGVVTSFEVQLRPAPAEVRVSTWTYPLDELAAVTRWVTEASAGLEPNVEVAVVTQGVGRPGGTAEHPLVVGVAATAVIEAHGDGDGDGVTDALAPLGDGAPGLVPLGRFEGPARLSELHVPVDATYPEGARYLADTFWTHLPLDEAMAPLEALMACAPSGKSYVLTGMPANGRGAELLPVGEAAYGLHDTTVLIVYVIWDDPADDAANRAWLDEVAAALLPTCTGHVLSEADIREHPERIARSFRDEDWPRIRDLIARFDPDTLFHGFPETAPVG